MGSTFSGKVVMHRPRVGGMMPLVQISTGTLSVGEDVKVSGPVTQTYTHHVNWIFDMSIADYVNPAAADAATLYDIGLPDTVHQDDDVTKP